MLNSQPPLVSVIMPAYNVDAYVVQAIRSVLNQTYTHFELLIADDHSADQTLAYIESVTDDRIRVLKNTRNLGYAGNMNTLFKAAKGQYIILQDADDYSAENRLQVLVDFLESRKLIDMVGSSYIKINAVGKQELIRMSENADEINKAFENMIDPLPVLNGSVMFRRKIIEEGFFYRDLHYVNRSQDDDWLFRVSEKFNLSNVADYLYYYRFNPSSMTMDISTINYYSLFSGDYVRFLKKNRMKEGIDLLDQKKTIAIESFFQEKKKELTDQQLAYLEIYIAHKYLAFERRGKALQWMFKALLKDPMNVFIWKKIIFVLLRKKS